MWIYGQARIWDSYISVWNLLVSTPFSAAHNTLTIFLACKLHNFIRDSGDDSYFDSLEVTTEKNVLGSPVLYLQNDLHTKQAGQRRGNRAKENSMTRDRIAEELNKHCLLRPSTRRENQGRFDMSTIRSLIM